MPDDAAADALLEKIEAKASELLEPLLREMKIKKWPADYRSIMWSAVAHKALRYSNGEGDA